LLAVFDSAGMNLSRGRLSGQGHEYVVKLEL
jgi:hypothetical protein